MLKGHWKNVIPHRSGLYWAATRDGDLAGPFCVVCINNVWVSVEHRNIGSWQGWWWSEPLEEPRRPLPVWEE